MSEKYVGKDPNIPDIIAGIDDDVINPVVVTEPFAENILAAETIDSETEASKTTPDKASAGKSFPHGATAAWDDGPFRWWLE